MAETCDEITPDMANHVLAHFGEGGHRADSFTMLLIELIARADPWNRSRLALGFPAYVNAVQLAQDTRGEGMAELAAIAGWRS